MKRSEDALYAELESLYTFANLHRWVAQLSQRIDAFAAAAADKAEGLARFIREHHTDPSDAKNSLVLSLVLLSKLGASTYELSEQLFTTLRNRLDASDQAFLTWHLFHDTRPLPQDLSYDITNRPFFSFRRAISRAMQIESAPSAFAPQRTALYLAMIMCRVDLNEQNRAMLGFLLSRIDVELPDNLRNGVFSYVRSLKHVLADLERKGDQALKGELDYTHESVTLEGEPFDWSARRQRSRDPASFAPSPGKPPPRPSAGESESPPAGNELDSTASTPEVAPADKGGRNPGPEPKGREPERRKSRTRRDDSRHSAAQGADTQEPEGRDSPEQESAGPESATEDAEASRSPTGTEDATSVDQPKGGRPGSAAEGVGPEDTTESTGSAGAGEAGRQTPSYSQEASPDIRSDEAQSAPADTAPRDVGEARNAGGGAESAPYDHAPAEERDAEADSTGEEDSAVTGVAPEWTAPRERRAEQPTAPSNQVEKPTYRIAFTRNTEELLRIIDDLESQTAGADEQQAPSPASGSSDAQGETEQHSAPDLGKPSEPLPDDEAADKTGGRVSGRTPRSRTGLIAAVAVAVGAALLVLLLLIAGVFDEATNQDPTPADVEETPPAAEEPVEPPIPIPDPDTPAPSDPSVPDGDLEPIEPLVERGTAEDYHLEREAGTPVWYVRSGNNLWTLYQLSRRGELSYELPPDLPWRQFFLDVLDANLDLSQLHLLPIGARMTLPDY